MLELGRIPCFIPSKMLKQMEEKVECAFDGKTKGLPHNRDSPHKS